MGTFRLAQLVGVSQDHVLQALKTIQAYNYAWVEVSKGYGDDEAKVKIAAGEMENVLRFLEQGGFTGLADKADIIHKEEQQKQLKETQLRELQIDQLLRAPNERKKDRIVPKWGLLVAIVSAIISLLLALFSR